MIARVAHASAVALMAFALVGPTDAAGGATFASRPNEPTQWWRCTGHLRAEDGRRFDFGLTIFRYTAYVSRARFQGDRRSNDGTTYSATFAITDEEGRTFDQDDRHERAAFATASAASDRFAVAVADWSLGALSTAPDATVRVRAATHTDVLDLALVPTKRAFAIADGELDRPSLRASGTLVVAGRTLAVRGDAWLDTSFGAHARARDASGWDRFWIELDDGRAMLYEIERRRDGSRVVDRSILIDRRGRVAPLPLASVALASGVHVRAHAGWRSLRTGAGYPNIWGLNLPAFDMQLSLEPVLSEQEIVARGGLPFWSGAIEIYDVRPWSEGLRLGRGFVELSGYTRPIDL